MEEEGKETLTLTKTVHGEIDSHPDLSPGGSAALRVVIHAVGRGAGSDFHRELVGPLSGEWD